MEKKGNKSEMPVWHRISAARSPTRPTLSKTRTGLHDVSVEGRRWSAQTCAEETTQVPLRGHIISRERKENL